MIAIPTALVGYLSTFLQVVVLLCATALVCAVRGPLGQKRWDAWTLGSALYAAALMVLALGSLAADLGGPAFAPFGMAFYITVEDIAAICFIAGARAHDLRVAWPRWLTTLAALLTLCAIGSQSITTDFAHRYTVHGVVMCVLFGWTALETARAGRRRPGVGIALIVAAFALLAIDAGQFAVLHVLGFHVTDEYIGIDAYVTMLLDIILGFGLVLVSTDDAGRRLRLLSISDSLSGLRNRSAFAAVLATAPPAGAVAMIDLDRLKHINDRYGHHSGDRAIIAIGAALNRVVASPDHAFRIGGDEFALIVPEGYSADLDAQLKRVNDELAAIDDPERGDEDPLVLSWGVAAFGTATLEEAMAAADAALYARKAVRS